MLRVNQGFNTNQVKLNAAASNNRSNSVSFRNQETPLIVCDKPIQAFVPLSNDTLTPVVIAPREAVEIKPAATPMQHQKTGILNRVRDGGMSVINALDKLSPHFTTLTMLGNVVGNNPVGLE